jgi:hypothetical protein
MTKKPTKPSRGTGEERESPAPAAAPGGEVILYQTEDGRTRVECRFADETLWLSQALMAELFQTTAQNITQHLRALYREGELAEAATCKDFLQVRAEGARRVKRAVKHYMGLTAWQSGSARKTDVTVAKNYLREPEIVELNRIVTMWLDFAEDQAGRRKQVFLADWETKLDEFLRFNDRAVLPHAGKVTKQDADARAQDEYERFAARRRREREDAGETDSIRALEEAAKRLPPPEKGK